MIGVIGIEMGGGRWEFIQKPLSFFNLNIFINYRPECCIVKERNKRIQKKI